MADPSVPPMANPPMPNMPMNMIDEPMDQAVPQVSLFTATWARESHGLFDYEARHPIKKEFRIQQPTTVLRKGTDVLTQPGPPTQQAPEHEPLARLVTRGGKFCVDAARIGENGRVKSGKLWRVVKDLQGGYSLVENDSIKLGRFKLKVRQIVAGDPHNNTPITAAVNPHSLPPRPCDTSPEKLALLETVPCRICLLEGSSPEDPLIAPCECRGTIQYVHLACLRHWVKGKLDLSESQSGSYFYKPMSCELCKTQYATHLQDTQNPASQFPLIELPKTTPPFIVLERDSNRPELKGVHVISLAEKKLLKLGRGHESDVRFADVSISRWHATVHYCGEKNHFVLTDHGSKFGTLVAMRTPVPLEGGCPLSLQAGRTVLHFALQMPGSDSRRHMFSFQNVVNLEDEDEVPSNNHPVGTGSHNFAIQDSTPTPAQNDQSMQMQHMAAFVPDDQQGYFGFPFAGQVQQPSGGQPQPGPAHPYVDEPEALLALRLSLLSHNQGQPQGGAVPPNQGQPQSGGVNMNLALHAAAVNNNNGQQPASDGDHPMPDAEL